ncbi:MAG: TIGR03905 family TSCPD domain-containing protein [Lachnospiraceae bacterium]|nr:TIGR03905 family TSCPD domain-containing protein [Lachnospiraceae bacterium]
MVYRTSGVCSTQIEFDIEEIDGRQCVRNVKFFGGCNGNLKGISQLVDGMPVRDVVSKLEGTTCGYKSTSCPDQLAKALRNYI